MDQGKRPFNKKKRPTAGETALGRKKKCSIPEPRKWIKRRRHVSTGEPPAAGRAPREIGRLKRKGKLLRRAETIPVGGTSKTAAERETGVENPGAHSLRQRPEPAPQDQGARRTTN